MTRLGRLVPIFSASLQRIWGQMQRLEAVVSARDAEKRYYCASRDRHFFKCLDAFQSTAFSLVQDHPSELLTELPKPAGGDRIDGPRTHTVHFS